MMLWQISEPILFGVALLAFLLAMEIGFLLGRHFQKSTDENGRSHVFALQAALLGLLALLLGFNFAMAASRFDTRKHLIAEELVALNSCFLRAKLLPSPQKEEIGTLLKSYVDARIEFMRAGTNEELIAKSYLDAQQIEKRLWETTINLVNADSSSAKPLFLESLNEMINITQKRRVALDNHVPVAVIYLLLTVAIGSMGFIGYSYGLTGKRRHGSTAILAILVALVLTTILDLDQPRSGFIQVGEEAITKLKGTLSE